MKDMKVRKHGFRGQDRGVEGQLARGTAIRLIGSYGARERHKGSLSQMKKAAAMATSYPPNESVDLVCGVRMGAINTSWPGAWCRVSDEGVAFDCAAVEVQTTWTDVVSVEVVKRFHLIGSGVRFRIQSLTPDTVLVWLGNRNLVDRVIDVCMAHEIPVVRNPEHHGLRIEPTYPGLDPRAGILR